MQRRLANGSVAAGLVLLATAWEVRVAAADGPAEAKSKGTVIRLAGGALTMKAPSTWKSKKPRFRIIEYEFVGPRVEGDEADARITIMGAGGSVAANIDRWKAQFRKVRSAKQEQKKVGGAVVHLVDIRGVFRDRRGGPFSGAPEKLLSGYRMLGAIIVTPKQGRYFVKMYGPEKTVAAHAAAFGKLIDSIELAKGS